MNQSGVFKLTMGECKGSVQSLRTLLSSSLKYSLHAIVILLQYLLEMFAVLLFTSEVNKAH